jgi:hypothetical protein
MKSVECWQVAFGYEFGDGHILQLADKGGKVTVEQGRTAAEAAHEILYTINTRRRIINLVLSKEKKES